MNFKQFLKPNWRKIVVFIVLLIVSYFRVIFTGIASISRGAPFPYYIRECSDIMIGGYLPPCSSYINWNYLTFDIISWYLLSCLIIWIYDKIKKEK